MQKIPFKTDIRLTRQHEFTQQAAAMLVRYGQDPFDVGQGISPEAVHHYVSEKATRMSAEDRARMMSEFFKLAKSQRDRLDRMIELQNHQLRIFRKAVDMGPERMLGCRKFRGLSTGLADYYFRVTSVLHQLTTYRAVVATRDRQNREAQKEGSFFAADQEDLSDAAQSRHAWEQPQAWLLTRWVEMQCPVYFVGDALMDAAVRSEAPGWDYSMAELKWPMPAMLMMFPPGYLELHHPENDIPSMDAIGIIMGRADKEGCLRMDQVFLESIGLESDKEIAQCAVGDIAFIMFRDTRKEDGTVRVGFSDEEQLLAVKPILYTLLYLMVERPELVEHGGRDPKGVERKGKPLLWTPNYIGRRYVREAATADAVDGTERGTNRTHWRRAHWRMQAVGPRSGKERRRTWIDKILVNADAEKRHEKPCESKADTA